MVDPQSGARCAIHDTRTAGAERYHWTVTIVGEPEPVDTNVDLTPGEQIYVKIVSLDSWGSSVSGCKNCARDAFYAWLIPPDVAQVEIARDRSGI